jgi:hypothetical protein
MGGTEQNSPFYLIELKWGQPVDCQPLNAESVDWPTKPGILPLPGLRR